ncbi:hypothetical protein ANN_21042 [Periplaneta americana]|uniref:Reverse transcriptase n=1 Tax=Periplaneta americana TaxID=6978 RepID=A0ABQ8SEK9_PERAM|nr:hypothetical protein ANN_21042 [Periplaneta americana]
MTAHVSSVRSLPGRTRDNILCRRCHREPETLAHVLGSCPHGEVLRNSRHHRIRSMIAEQFRSINFQVFEEVHGLADNGSTRRIDMIAIPLNNNNGYIIDPTVRFEKQRSQPEDVNREKNDIYSKQASLVYRSSTRVCVRNCASIRRPEFECSGPQLEGPEFECSEPQLERPEFEYSELSLKEEEKELVRSLAEKKLPTEGCTGRNGEQKKSSGQKKISDDRRHQDIWIICGDKEEGRK